MGEFLGIFFGVLAMVGLVFYIGYFFGRTTERERLWEERAKLQKRLSSVNETVEAARHTARIAYTRSVNRAMAAYRRIAAPSLDEAKEMIAEANKIWDEEHP